MNQIYELYDFYERKELISNLLYGTLGALALGIFFYILIGAILQTSYRLSPVTPEEMGIEVMSYE